MFFFFLRMHFVFSRLFSLFVTGFSYLIFDYTITTKFQNFGNFINKKFGFQIFKLLDLDIETIAPVGENSTPKIFTADNGTLLSNPSEGNVSKSPEGVNYKVNLTETKTNITNIAVAGIFSTALVIIVYTAGYFWGGHVDKSHVAAITSTLENTRVIMLSIAQLTALINGLSQPKVDASATESRTDDMRPQRETGNTDYGIN